MSISALRDLMERPGCRWLVTLLFTILGLSFIATARSCGPIGGNGPGQAGGNDNYVAKIGQTEVPEAAIVKDAQDQARPQATVPANPTLQALADAYVRSVANNMDRAFLVELATKEGIKIDGDAVVSAVKSQMAEQFSGQNSAETKKIIDQIAENAKRSLEEPDQRLQIQGNVANTLLSDFYQKQINVTDEQIRNSYNSYSMKRILLATKSHPKEDIQKLAQTIVADLRAKKMTFEQAMDKYTDDPPATGKAKHDNTYQVDVKTLELTPELKPLLSLKPSEISDPLAISEGVGIYRLDSIQSALPPDFDKNKVQFRKQYLNGLAVQKLQEGLDKLRNGNSVSWKNEGFKLAYEWNRFTSSPSFNSMPLPEKKAAIQDFIKRGGEAAAQADAEGTRAAQSARYQAFNMLSDLSTPDERKALDEQKLQLYTEILNVMNDPAVRIDLAKMLAAKKDGKGVVAALQAAADANQGDFSATGVRNFGDLNAAAEKYQNEGLLSSADVKAIRDSSNTWRKSKLEYDREMERQRKEQEEQQKKEEEERKKAEAEAKKPILRGATTTTGSSTAGATPPSTTGAAAPATTGATSLPTTGGAPATTGTPVAPAPAKPPTTATTGK